MAAGALAVVQGLFFIAGDALIISVSGSSTMYLVLLGVLEIVLGIVSVRAGMSTRDRENYRFALIGSVLGMVAFGLGVGGFLGLVAVMLVALSQAEFRS